MSYSTPVHSAKSLRVGDRCASVGGTVTRITHIGNYVKIELDYQGEKKVIECSQNRKFVLFNR